MKPRTFLILLAMFCLPWLLTGQIPQPAAPTDAKQPAVDPTPAGPIAPSPTPTQASPTTTATAAAAVPLPETSSTAAQTVPALMSGTAGDIRFNFQGADLSDVLTYLSQAAGFIIVQDVPVSGTVNVISRQAVTPDEAVDLLNSVLLEKNYVALRNGRILKIVSRTDAQKLDLPVATGADPNQIPRKDNMVTQILPVRYVDVTKLIDNLRPLLSDNASITANDSSNAIILTDSQTNVRRMAEIITALDTSISGIATIHVFPLQYADAKQLADTLTQLFSPPQGSSNNQRQQSSPGVYRSGGSGGGTAPPSSDARVAASRVIAVADQPSNSVVVSAPDEYMATISEIVSRLDTSISDITETRIFHLLHADATEMANILNSLYSSNPTTSSQTGRPSTGAARPVPAAAAASNGQPSMRAILEAQMVAVADPRTNTVIVSASRDSMEDIALTVGRLDASDTRKQHVRVYTLENADPDNVASILRGMFTINGSQNTSNQNLTDVLSQRTTTGASSSVTNGFGSSSNNNRSSPAFR